MYITIRLIEIIISTSCTLALTYHYEGPGNRAAQISIGGILIGWLLLIYQDKLLCMSQNMIHCLHVKGFWLLNLLSGQLTV